MFSFLPSFIYVQMCSYNLLRKDRKIIERQIVHYKWSVLYLTVR